MNKAAETQQKKYDYNPVGNRNDRICRALLARELLNGKTVHVIDVADDKFFQKKDIDMICVNSDLKCTSVEIKADNYAAVGGTKYVYLETISNSNKYLRTHSREGKGCMLITQSDYLIFYFIRNDNYMIIRTKDLKQYIYDNLDSGKYEIKSAVTYGYDGNILYNSYGMLVPVNDLVEKVGARVVQSKVRYSDMAKEVA